MLNLDFRLVSQCICLLVSCIFSTIDLICSFHVSCVSKWSPRYLTCCVCVIYVSFRRMFDGILFRSVNVIWLHLLGFAFIWFSCSHFSIFVICSCSNLTAVSGLLCLTSIAVSSVNVSTLLLVVVGMLAVYNVYSIGPRTLPCGTPALMSLTWEYVSLIFITKVLLLRWDFINWCIAALDSKLPNGFYLVPRYTRTLPFEQMIARCRYTLSEYLQRA